MGQLHPESKYIDLYYAAIDKFCSLIDEEYEHKKLIIKKFENIKYKLAFSAPEVINFTFGKKLQDITPLLPKEQKEWSDKGWKIIIDSYIKGHQLTIQDFPEQYEDED